MVIVAMTTTTEVMGSAKEPPDISFYLRTDNPPSLSVDATDKASACATTGVDLYYAHYDWY